LASPTSGHDPPNSGAVVDHGSLSESLQFSQSPFPSPCLCEKKKKRVDKKERHLCKGKRGRRKKKEEENEKKSQRGREEMKKREEEMKR